MNLEIFNILAGSAVPYRNPLPTETFNKYIQVRTTCLSYTPIANRRLAHHRTEDKPEDIRIKLEAAFRPNQKIADHW